MKLTLALAVSAVFFMAACHSKNEKPKSFCEDPCLKDSLKFNSQSPGKSYVYISAKSCSPDTLVWSNKFLETERKMGLSNLLGQPVSLSSKYTNCFIKDTSYAWLWFNDCSTFRGFLLKLPYSKNESISKYSSALTNFDPKFKIAEGLICYADYAFVYVEDMATGKKEELQLADKELDINFNDIHATFDSVNVSRSRIFVSLLINGNKKTLEKNISL
jgi:hypothetical protein